MTANIIGCVTKTKTAFRSRTQSVVTGTEVREKFRRVKPLGEIRGSAPAPKAFGAGICAATIDFDPLRQPRSCSPRGRAELQPRQVGTVLPISPVSWKSFTLTTPINGIGAGPPRQR